MHKGRDGAATVPQLFTGGGIQNARRFVRATDGDLVIDTLPPGVQIDMPREVKVIAAAYDRGGLALFQEQALPQNELFLEAFR